MEIKKCSIIANKTNLQQSSNGMDESNYRQLYSEKYPHHAVGYKEPRQKKCEHI